MTLTPVLHICKEFMSFETSWNLYVTRSTSCAASPWMSERVLSIAES